MYRERWISMSILEALLEVNMKIYDRLDDSESKDASDLIRMMIKDKNENWVSCGSTLILRNDNHFEIYIGKVDIDFNKKDIEQLLQGKHINEIRRS
jgi:hypothetical protein